MAAFFKICKKNFLAHFAHFGGKTEFSSNFDHYQFFFLILNKYDCVKFFKKTTESIPGNTGFRRTYTHGRASINL